MKIEDEPNSTENVHIGIKEKDIWVGTQWPPKSCDENSFYFILEEKEQPDIPLIVMIQLVKNKFVQREIKTYKNRNKKTIHSLV